MICRQSFSYAWIGPYSDGMSDNGFLDLSYIPWILVGRDNISSLALDHAIL
jgi:hypothetical protein